MQTNLLDTMVEPTDYSGKKVLLPLSAGINSGAALIYMGEYHPRELLPRELHLYYTHLREHSPESLQFVYDLILYARTRFPFVTAEITSAGVLDYFREQKMIPHPTVSPCARDLKILPRLAYQEKHGIDAVIVGFVRHERDRIANQQGHNDHKAAYPIAHLTDEDCLSLVKGVIGWYPPIYDITERRGRKRVRVFSHNNCLPCKNWHGYQIEDARRYYPKQMEAADDLAVDIGSYWGRTGDVPEVMACQSCTLF